MKEMIIKALPGSLLRFISGFRYGWRGDFRSWEEAMKHCTGYAAENILDAVRNSAIQVHKGNEAYERDSVIYDEIQYNYPLLSALMWTAARSRGSLHVMDFGGSLGTTYRQNRSFLDTLPDLQWSIVEQPAFVEAGRSEFTTEHLKFYGSIDDCLQAGKANLVLLSSVLQYLEKPYELLADIINRDIETIVVDRTPFIRGHDRITVQKVNPSIYRAKYPCWFFDQERFLAFMGEKYDLLLTFDALDRANIPSAFKGFIFRKKTIHA
jgi:putative methyltransferase (TIGR04325 family)